MAQTSPAPHVGVKRCVYALGNGTTRRRETRKVWDALGYTSRVRRLSIKITTVPFLVEVPEGPLAQSLSAAWKDFRVPERAGARSIRFTPDAREVPSGPRTMPQVVGGKIRGQHFEAVVTGNRAEVVGADERMGVETVLKLMLARALLPLGGLLVHSVGLCVGNRAAVLLGESGAGKSTLGELGAQNGLERLADELVVLMGGRAWGTPWNVGLARSAGVALLGTLGWDSTPRIDAVAAADFVPLLLSNTLLPDDTPATRAAVFGLATRLLEANPPVRFFFPPDASAARFLRAQLD